MAGGFRAICIMRTVAVSQHVTELEHHVRVRNHNPIHEHVRKVTSRMPSKIGSVHFVYDGRTVSVKPDCFRLVLVNLARLTENEPNRTHTILVKNSHENSTRIIQGSVI